MNLRSLTQTLAATAVLCTTMAAAPVQAASFTLIDNNCASFSFDSATSTLTCVPASGGLSSCTSISGPSSGVWGTGITLTAVCTNSPQEYVWTGGTCAGVTTSTCDANAGAGTNSVTYTVKANNGTGNGTVAASKTVGWSATAPPTGCVAVANPTSVPQTGGTAVALSVTCVGTTLGTTTYQWKKGGASLGAASTTSGSSNTPVANPLPTSITIGYTVDVCNGAGSTACMTPAAALVSQAGATGGGGTGTCPAGLSMMTLPSSWFGSQLWTTDFGGMYVDTAVVGKINVPVAIPNGKKLRDTIVVSSDGLGGSLPVRHLTLSTQMCNFGQDPNNPPIAQSWSSVPGFSFTYLPAKYVAPTASSPGVPLLTLGVDYYINMRNYNKDGTPSWGPGNPADATVILGKQYANTP